jgi:hypothetical protein
VPALVLAAFLAGCGPSGPQLQLGATDASYAVTLASGEVIATATLVGDHLLRVRLSYVRSNQESGPCRLSLPGGTSCDTKLLPVKGEVITLHASAGTLSATTMTTDADGSAAFDLVAPQGEPITLTAESGLMKLTHIFTLQAPFTQLRFGPVGDAVIGQLLPRKTVYVQFLDPDGNSPEYARDPPPVHFELVGCDANATLFGNDQGVPSDEGGLWSRRVAFDFARPGVGCRWTAAAPGFETITSNTFSVR